MKITIAYCRTLMSQSGGSLTANSMGAYLEKFGNKVNLSIINRKETLGSIGLSKSIRLYSDVLIMKVNFQDIELLMGLAKSAKDLGLVKYVGICGPFVDKNRSFFDHEYSWVDGLIVGQMETSALAFVQSLKAARAISNPNGVHVPDVFSTPTIDLAILPRPLRIIEKAEETTHVNIEASRGCTFGCSFCHHAKTAVTTKPVPQLIEEISFLNRSLGKTFFIFNDPCFWSGPSDNERIEAIATGIIEANLNISFYVYLRLNPFIPKHLLILLKNAGLCRIFIGVESADELIQRGFQKPIDIGAFVKTRHLIENELNLNVHIGFITIGPYTTVESLRQNVEFLHRINKLFRLGIICEPMRVIPNSTMHHKLVKDGLLDENFKLKEITYGYDYADRRIKTILNRIVQVLQYGKANLSFRYEYYSTAYPLLMSISNRYNVQVDDFSISLVTQLDRLRSEGMDRLYNYFQLLINSVENSGTLENAYDAELLRSLSSITSSMQIAYETLILHIAETPNGRKAVDQIYTGQEGLMHPINYENC